MGGDPQKCFVNGQCYCLSLTTVKPLNRGHMGRGELSFVERSDPVWEGPLLEVLLYIHVIMYIAYVNASSKMEH